MGQERNGDFENYDQTTKQVADICGASQGASNTAKGTEPINRKERAEYSEQVRPCEETALKEWAVKNNLWISESRFLLQYKDRYIGAGLSKKFI